MDAIYSFVSGGQLFLVIGVVVTFLSVFGLLYPLLKKREASERYRDIITEKRRALFEQARHNDKKIIDEAPQISAKESLSTLFKLEKLSGARAARLLLIQGGYRSSKALLIYLLSRLVLPTVFVLIAFMVITHSSKDIHRTLALLIYFGLGVLGYFMPYILVKNTAQKRQEEIQVTFPDALDMMLICVQGGISIESAISRIAERMAEHAPILAEELGILSAELAMLNERKIAYKSFADRVGSASARTFVNAMVQAEQYGSSVSQAMRVIAEELRDMRMSLAEQKAMALPPKLTVPMILFFLPSLFIVILGPAIIKAQQTFNN